MTTPTWAVESCDADSTEHTTVIDHYGPTSYPASAVAMFVAQRESTRHGLTLHDPARAVMYTERPATSLDAAGLRALAREALDLADALDALD